MTDVDLRAFAGAVQGQAGVPSPANPISPSNVYGAYLEKADQVTTTSTWDLMFDMVPAEALLLGLHGRAPGGPPAPAMPTVILHIADAPDDAVASLVATADAETEPAEGSWYALELSPADAPGTQIVGDLYHPDIDVDLSAPAFGRWGIARSTLLLLPVAPRRPTDPLYRRPSTPKPPPELLVDPDRPRKRGRDVYEGVIAVDPGALGQIRGDAPMRPMKRARRERPDGFAALGVLDVGQGGCNLLLDRPVPPSTNLEPSLYYDVGYPLPFHAATAPVGLSPLVRNPQGPGMVVNPNYTPPIWDNTAGTLEVVLSHWDWDHWRCGAMGLPLGVPVAQQHTNLRQLRWTYPQQQMGPTATNFAATLARRQVVLAGAASQGIHGATVYKLTPAPGHNAAFVINNSGLALAAPVDLAQGRSSPTLLTGDGNLDLLPMPVHGGARVINAVHHGSAAHGADQSAPWTQGGMIAYSFGVTPGPGPGQVVHAYGFPNGQAVGTYRGRGWVTPQSTAQGPNLNLNVIVPGNIRVGNPTALSQTYGASAFFATPKALP